MTWWTILIAACLGFVFGGPIGALLGAALAATIGRDRRTRRQNGSGRH